MELLEALEKAMVKMSQTDRTRLYLVLRMSFPEAFVLAENDLIEIAFRALRKGSKDSATVPCKGIRTRYPVCNGQQTAEEHKEVNLFVNPGSAHPVRLCH